MGAASVNHSLSGTSVLSLEITGTFTIGGSLSVTDPLVSSRMNGGTLSGTLGGAGTFQVDGYLNMPGGTMKDAGTTSISSTGTLSLQGWCCSAAQMQSGRVVNNQGLIYIGGQGLSLYDNVRIYNTGNLQIESGGYSHLSDATTNKTSLIVNTGTIKKVGASTGSKSIGAPLENDGIVTTASGTGPLTLDGASGGNISSGEFSGEVTINSPSGNPHVLGNATFTGSSTKISSATIVSGQTARIVAGASSTLSGTLGGAGTFQVDGTFNWSGGTMQNAGQTRVEPSGLLSITGTGAKSLQSGRIISNSGTFSLNGVLSAYAGSTVINSGTFSIPGDHALSNQAGSGTKPQIVNTGTIYKSSGTGSANLGANLDNTDGTIKVDSGTLSVQGNLDNYSTTMRRLSGGTYVLKGGLRFDNADIADIRADVTLDGSSATITDQSGFNGLRSLNRVSGAGWLKLTGGKTLTATGTMTNSGRVDIGSSSTFASSGVTNSGSISLSDATARLEAPTATVSVVTGGSLSGVGTIQASLANSGAVNLGNTTPGTLNVTGSYIQGSTGVLNADVISTSSYDRLSAGGTATLDGTLSMDASSYSPTVGDRFSVLTHSGRTGSFAEIHGINLSGGRVFVVENTASALDLVTSDPSPWGGAVTINSGETYATSRDVTLTITPPNAYDVTAMRIANDQAPSGIYQAFAGTVNWELANQDGTRAVHVQLKDSAGNVSEVILDSIVLDRIAPEATITTPTSSDGVITIDFTEDVTSVTNLNLVLWVTGTPVDLPAVLECKDANGAIVTCAVGLTHRVVMTPVSPLLPLTSYTVTVNPSGQPPATDQATNPAVTTSRSFTI
jgi:hypothetical protein